MHVMNGGLSRFEEFCDALIANGQDVVVFKYLKPKDPENNGTDTCDAVPADASLAGSESSHSVLSVSLPASRQQSCDILLRSDCQQQLRENWNELYSNMRSDEEFLSHLTRLGVFTDMQLKRLQVCPMKFCYF